MNDVVDKLESIEFSIDSTANRLEEINTTLLDLGSVFKTMSETLSEIALSLDNINANHPS